MHLPNVTLIATMITIVLRNVLKPTRMTLTIVRAALTVHVSTFFKQDKPFLFDLFVPFSNCYDDPV